MKKWMNWIVIISLVLVVLSGITIVFASNNESSEPQGNQENQVASIYENPRAYKIHTGDSLWKLTSDYSGSMGRQELILEIMAYNQIDDPGKLRVNHVIYLPDCLSLID